METEYRATHLQEPPVERRRFCFSWLREYVDRFTREAVLHPWKVRAAIRILDLVQRETGRQHPLGMDPVGTIVGILDEEHRCAADSEPE